MSPGAGIPLHCCPVGLRATIVASGTNGLDVRSAEVVSGASPNCRLLADSGEACRQTAVTPS